VHEELRLHQVLNPQVNSNKAYPVPFAEYYESTTTPYGFHELTGLPGNIETKKHNGVSRRNPSG
jgi:hypothetical protein